jgi:hypothetical protein
MLAITCDLVVLAIDIDAGSEGADAVEVPGSAGQ